MAFNVYFSVWLNDQFDDNYSANKTKTLKTQMSNNRRKEEDMEHARNRQTEIPLARKFRFFKQLQKKVLNSNVLMFFNTNECFIYTLQLFETYS